jgi:hypothetical protein
MEEGDQERQRHPAGEMGLDSKKDSSEEREKESRRVDHEDTSAAPGLYRV